MNCPKCHNAIVADINFCSFCREKINSSAKDKKLDERDTLIHKYIKQENYDKILELALEGSLLAEYAFIMYFRTNNWNVKEEVINNLSERAKETPASAILAIYSLTWVVDKCKELQSKENLVKVCQNVETAALEGEPAAAFYLGLIYLGNVSERYARNEMKSYRYLKQSADAGYPEALRELSNWHYQGENGVNKDENLARLYLSKAIFYESFLPGGNENIDEGLEQYLTTAITENAILFVKKDSKNNIAENENISLEQGEEVEKLWAVVKDCGDIDSLKKAKECLRNMDGSSETKKEILGWIEDNIDYITIHNRKIEEARRKEEAKEKERLIREPAEKIIKECKTEKDYLTAIDKLKELKLPENYFNEYNDVLNKKFNEEFKSTIAAADALEEAAKKKRTGITCAILFLIFIVFMTILYYEEGIIILGIIFGVGGMIWVEKEYSILHNMSVVEEGERAVEFLRKYRSKGYRIGEQREGADNVHEVVTTTETRRTIMEIEDVCAIYAPFEGLVYDIKACVGQTVKKDECLVVFMPMGMHSMELLAPQDGIVISIEVSVREEVKADTVLITLK